MTKENVQDLTPALINIVIAKLEGLNLLPWLGFPNEDTYSPVTKWEQCMPILMKKHIAPTPNYAQHMFSYWSCTAYDSPEGVLVFTGDTFQEAGLKAYIASFSGEFIEL